MRASCRRPGCSAAASVVILYDPVACQVWIDPIGDPVSGGHPLCEQHVARLNPPQGWVVLDRRPAVVAAPPARRPSRPSRAKRASTTPAAPERSWGRFEESPAFIPPPEPSPAVALVAEVEPVVAAPEPEVEPVAPESVAAAPEPVAAVPEPEVESVGPEPLAAEAEAESVAPVDDLGRFFEPKGGLLGRAFRSTGHQRSVLTVDED